MARNYFSGMSGVWVVGLNENITNSVPNWVWLGLGAELGKFSIPLYLTKSALISTINTY